MTFIVQAHAFCDTAEMHAQEHMLRSTTRSKIARMRVDTTNIPTHKTGRFLRLSQ